MDKLQLDRHFWAVDGITLPDDNGEVTIYLIDKDMKVQTLHISEELLLKAVNVQTGPIDINNCHELYLIQREANHHLRLAVKFLLDLEKFMDSTFWRTMYMSSPN